MVRGVQKKQVRSVAECSSRRKKHIGKSKRLKSRKNVTVEHDIETASETDFDVNKDVGKCQSMKKCPGDTPSESSENESMPMDKGDANRKHPKKHPRQFDTETSESCHDLSDRSSNSGYSSENDPNIIDEVLSASSTDYSSDGCNKKYRGMMKSRNNFGVTYYRSNLKTSINDISKLKFTEAHLEMIKRTPMWFFFDDIYRKCGRKLMQKTDKVDRDIGRLIKCFDNRKSRFIIGGEVVPLTCRDVSLIFGVTGGKLIIPVKNKRGPIVPWFVHAMQNSSVAWPVTETVEDFDEVGKYTWCQYIIDVLWKQMKSSLNMKYWLCEHTQLVKPGGEDLFLRFMKWDLQELKSSFLSVKLLKINPKKVYLTEAEGCSDELSGEAKTHTTLRGVSCLEHNSGGSDPLGFNDEYNSGGSNPLGVNDDYHSGGSDPVDESLNLTQATTTPNGDVQKVIRNVIDDLSKDDLIRLMKITEIELLVLKDVFSEIDAYNSRQPDVCCEIGVSSSNNMVHNQTLGGLNLLMELESLRQKNKELTEKIDRMNKEREIKSLVHEQNEGQFARLNVEDNHLKDGPVVDCDAYVGTSTKMETVLWRGVRPMSEVTLEYVIAILHHEKISDRVVNSWADLMKHKFAETDLGRYTTVFCSTCWELVTERDTNERKTLKHFVDDVLEESIENYFLMFLLWTKSDGKTTCNTPEHWNLLVLCLKNYEWRFYNSLQPREGGGKDVHLERVTYIERKIKEIYGRSNTGVVFMKPKVMACLQQETTSVDCGVVVCSVIENLLSGKGMKSVTMTHASAGNFRKKMVEQFMVSPFFVKRV
ncbi:hypothetical protein OROMI_008510 [Orobanche minor]